MSVMLPETRRRMRWFFIAALGVLAVVAAVAFRGAKPQPTAARVTVAVYDEGQPLPNAWVVFHDGEGNVVSRERSGRDGKASAAIAAGGMITVAQGESLHHLYTVVGVQPGDEIIVGEAVDEEGLATVVGSAKVRLPGRFPGAAWYAASLGVGATDAVDPAAVIPLPVFSRFLVEGTKFKVLAEALDDNGHPMAFAFAWAPWDAAKTTANAEIDVRLSPWSTEWRSFNVDLSNAPAEATTVEGKLSIYSKDEDRFDRRPRRAELHDRRASLEFRVPPPLGSEARYKIELSYGGSPDRAVLVRREESMATKVAFDLGNLLLPRISRAALENTGVLARPAVRWEISGDPSRADAVIARIAWPATREHVWTIVMPPKTPNRARLPVLPPELDAWRPDGRPMTAAVTLVEASFYAGYDEVRRKGMQVLSEPPEDEAGGTSLTYSVTGDLEF